MTGKGRTPNLALDAARGSGHTGDAQIVARPLRQNEFHIGLKGLAGRVVLLAENPGSPAKCFQSLMPNQAKPMASCRIGGGQKTPLGLGQGVRIVGAREQMPIDIHRHGDR